MRETVLSSGTNSWCLHISRNTTGKLIEKSVEVDTTNTRPIKYRYLEITKILVLQGYLYILYINLKLLFCASLLLNYIETLKLVLSFSNAFPVGKTKNH